MKIKVLHVIKSLGRGGAEMLLPETLQVHDTAVFEFHYLYFLPWKDQMVEAIEQSGGKVTCFAAKNNVLLLLQYKKIIRYCQEHDIQLLHAHLPWAGFVSRLVHLLTGIPVLYTEHNMQERYHVVTRVLNRFTFRYQTVGIGVSEEVTRSIHHNIGPKIPVHTVLNGVNTEAFQRQNPVAASSIRRQLGIPPDAFVVGTVAVFRFQKRLDLWLEIMKAALDKAPGMYGIVVGAGPLEAAIREKHQALGLEGKVFFVGLQTDVKPYYEAMDAFMMCSSFEGLPIALLEAMSMGCAVLTTAAGGVKEVLATPEHGIVVSVADWNTLADALLDLAHHREQLAALQRAARLRVEHSFSLNAMTVALEQLYKTHSR